MHNAKVVAPEHYAGAPAGHGSYMAGMVHDEMIRDERGQPIPFHAFPMEPQAAAAFGAAGEWRGAPEK